MASTLRKGWHSSSLDESHWQFAEVHQSRWCHKTGSAVCLPYFGPRCSLGRVYPSDFARVTSYTRLQNNPRRNGCHRHREGMEISNENIVVTSELIRTSAASF